MKSINCDTVILSKSMSFSETILLRGEMMSSVPSSAFEMISMTADAFQDDIEKAKQAGMDAHLSKPINPQDLYDTLSRFLAPKKPE